MGFKDFLFSAKKIILIARKPSKERFLTSLKASFLGLFLIGSISFIIQLLSTVLTLAARAGAVPTIPRETVIYVLVAIIVVVMGVVAYGRKAGWW
ncbi:MAG: protein translocase SEC61 complex subunit gamma [Thermoproteales archaeon]|nr:protein translocase SEC61 complex subunit gamma [Thermoproteales archaeon]